MYVPKQRTIGALEKISELRTEDVPRRKSPPALPAHDSPRAVCQRARHVGGRFPE
jgi:hypothetical protein